MRCLFIIYSEYGNMCNIWTGQLEQGSRRNEIIISRVLRFEIGEKVKYLGNSLLLKIIVNL